jgi:glycosyltransferase involved in cell wall biosynthesis
MVTPTFLPYVGGQETYVQKLSEALYARGHEITIFTTDAVSRNPLRRISSGRQIGRGLAVVRFPCYAFLYSYLPIAPGLAQALLAKEIVDYDIVHIHGYGHFTSDIAAGTGRLYGKPTILTTHGIHQETAQEGFIRQLLWFYYRGSIVASTVNSVDKILVLSQDEVDYLSRFGPHIVEKTRVVPIGVSLDDFPYPSRARQPTRPMILYVGRIDRGKGLEFLIDAVSRLKRYEPQLVIVGVRTRFASTLETLATQRGVSECVNFIGYLSEEDKNRLLSEATAFCLPSMYEGASLAILEAMAAGRPVVATRTGGVPYLVKDGSSGYLVNYADAEALSERLKELILNLDLRETMGKRGRAIAETHSWPEIAKKVEGVYMELK